MEGLSPIKIRSEVAPLKRMLAYSRSVSFPGNYWIEATVRKSVGTVWFGSTDTPGARTTLRACDAMGRPKLLVLPGQDVRPSAVAEWIAANRDKPLNAARNRECEASRIGDRGSRSASSSSSTTCSAGLARQ
jgi:hypothetical protein